MRSFLTLALAGSIASFPVLALADDPAPTSITLENQDYVIERAVKPDINGTIVRPLWGPFGVYSYFYLDESFAEGLIGPLYAPTKWLTLGAGVGLQQAPTSWRYGGMIGLNFEKYVSTTFIEDGGSGFWVREEFAWKPRHWIGLGALGDTSVGYGPRVQIDVPHTPFQVWGAVLYSKDGGTSIPAFGFRLNI